MEPAEPKPAQKLLFADEFAPRVLPIDARQRESLLKTARSKRQTGATDETSEIVPPRRPAPTSAQKTTQTGTKTGVTIPPRKQRGSDLQGTQETIDFYQIPAGRPVRPSTATTVDRTVDCDVDVANPFHRAVAAAIDFSMISLGIGLFVVIFEIMGGPFVWNRQTVTIWLAAAGLISMLYGFLWAVCGRESAGMDWAQLRLVNFNGFEPDGKSRALRLFGCWLSFGSGLIGVLWALMDEEGLTWHDHISKTFPAAREQHTALVRRRTK
jgi:hypothetical protein